MFESRWVGAGDQGVCGERERGREGGREGGREREREKEREREEEGERKRVGGGGMQGWGSSGRKDVAKMILQDVVALSPEDAERIQAAAL